MGIWLYQDYRNKNEKNNIYANTTYSTVRSKYCIFCKNQMYLLSYEDFPESTFSHRWLDKLIKICPVCGWWSVLKKDYGDFRWGLSEQERYDNFVYYEYGTVAILKKLDITDISIPIEDIKQYLLAKYEYRYDIHPRKLEEIVASIFRNIGYYVRITSYQNDGGIDVILDGKDQKTIGVQVKRYKNSIRVSQIREFTGALIENNMTNGIFVTTSSFQRGVYNSVSNFAEKGIGIKLIDSKKLYDALQIEQMDKEKYIKLVENLREINLELIYSDDESGKYIKDY